MDETPRIFLTPAQAVAAVRLDAGQYGPQENLWSGLRRLLAEGARAGPGASPVEPGGGGLPPPPQGDLAGEACALLAARSGDLELLAAALALVFETRAEPDRGPHGEPGVRVYTGMEGFSCTRCGRCCLILDFHVECRPGDLDLWKDAGRDDILAWVGEDPGGRTAGLLWVRPGTNFFTERCPWLFPGPAGRYACTIHDLKPAICRDYPGSRKHGRLTGCPGFAAAGKGRR